MNFNFHVDFRAQPSALFHMISDYLGCSNPRFLILFSSKLSKIIPSLVVDLPYDVASRSTQYHKMFTKWQINKSSLVCVYNHNGNCCLDWTFLYGRLNNSLPPSSAHAHSIARPPAWGFPVILEPASQFKITAKRISNRALYLKIIIQFRKISNYGIASLARGGVVGARSNKCQETHSEQYSA